MLSAREIITKPVEDLKRSVHAKKEEAAERQRSGGPLGRPQQANGGGDQAMAAAGPLEIPASRVSMLEGHGNEVFICAWSPTAPLLASG